MDKCSLMFFFPQCDCDDGGGSDTNVDERMGVH